MPTNLHPPAASAAGRIPLHTREVDFRVFSRPDGLWDVEGMLRDTKEAKLDRLSMPPLMPGDVVHAMYVTLTLDDELRIVAASARLEMTPFGECRQALEPLQRLVGRRIGRGWRRTLDECMGGVHGCTHLRELLVPLATAAIQGIVTYRDQRRAAAAGSILGAETMPHFVGGCMAWRRDGPVVARLLPQYSLPGPDPKEKP